MEQVRGAGEGVLASGGSSPPLALANANVRINWLALPTDDAVARLLLQLIGEAGLAEIFDD